MLLCTFAVTTRAARRVLALLLCGGATLAACTHNPSGPTPPPTPDAPRLACPAAQTAAPIDGQPMAVTYEARVSGGAAPVSLQCAPPSGTRFAIGSTPVSCVATDALQRTDTCSFSVTVQAPPRVSATTFT